MLFVPLAMINLGLAGLFITEFAMKFLNISEGNFFGAYISGSLSLLLVLIYYRQNKILQSQSDVLRAEHQPVVSIMDREVGVMSPSELDTRQSEDHVILSLKNSGNEVAMDIRLRAELHYETVGDEPFGTFISGLDEPDYPDRSTKSSGGNLPADNETEQFFTLVEFEITDSDAVDLSEDRTVHELPFTIAMNNLVESDDVETIFVGFFVQYRNTLGDEFLVGMNPAYKFDSTAISKPFTLSRLREEAEKEYIEKLFEIPEEMPLGQSLSEEIGLSSDAYGPESPG